MRNQWQKTSLLHLSLFGAAALPLVIGGCGGAEDGAKASNGAENVTEATQELTVSFQRGINGTVLDTAVESNEPSKNFGTAPTMSAGKDTSGVFFSLIYWDLSSIPAGATITSATLDVSSPFAIGIAPEVHRVTRSWGESTATWSNMGTGYDPAILATFPEMYAGSVYSSAPRHYTANVTSLVSAWVSGKYANQGLAIVPPAVQASPNSYAILASSDDKDAIDRPKLTVDYTLPACYGAADGTACNDGNACTQTDTCQAGKCVGANPVVCPSTNPCQANACNPATGTCSVAPLPNGTACDDGNLCTQTSSCSNGWCIGANPIQCKAEDPCHLPGVCDASTGTCSQGAPLSPADTQTGLEHHWKFDETGDVLLDSVSNTEQLLGPNVVRLPSFNGTTAIGGMEGCNGGYQSGFQILPQGIVLPYTVSMWVRFRDSQVLPSTGGRYLSLMSPVSDVVVDAMPGLLGLRYSEDANFGYVSWSSALPAQDPVWNHQTFVVEPFGVRMFINGVEAVHALSGQPFFDGGTDITMYTCPHDNFDVRYDEVRVYGRPLTTCDIATLANEPTGPASPGGGGSGSGGQPTSSQCGPTAVSSWKGDDSMVDSVGTNNGASGTQNGATPVTYAAGRDGNAWALNGTSFVEVPNASSLQFTGAMTMAAWVYINTPGGRIFDKVPVGTSKGYMLDTYQNKLRMIAGPYQVQSTPSTLPAGKWTHVAGSWDNGAMKLYVDGQLAHTWAAPNPKAITANTLPLRIGANANGGDRFNGLIDAAAVYDRALTDAEIAFLATAVPSVSPIGWWNGESSMTDATGINNGASGTLSGASPVSYLPGKQGKAFALNGNSFVQIPNSPSLQPTQAVTMSAWIYMKSAGGRIIDKTLVGSAAGYMLDTYQGKLRIISGQAGQQSSPNTLPLNEWTHVAGSWDGTTSRLYINGDQVYEYTHASPVPLPANTVPLRIGADSTGATRFNGLIDEAAVYAVALTPTQIKALATGARADFVATGCEPPSCKAILEANPSAPSGVYTISPTGTPFSTFCDMSLDGGGWSLVMRANKANSIGWSTQNALNLADLGNQNAANSSKAADTDINALVTEAYRAESFNCSTSPDAATKVYFGPDCVYDHGDLAVGPCAVGFDEVDLITPRLPSVEEYGLGLSSFDWTTQSTTSIITSDVMNGVFDRWWTGGLNRCDLEVFVK